MFKNKNCLVTGHCGMIGSKVFQLLRDIGANVWGADLKQGIDLREFRTCKRITRNMDYVFHIGGTKGSPKITRERPADFLVPMLQMNTNMLEACRVNNVKDVVYVSSIAAQTDENNQPLDYYPGWAKRMGEVQVQAYKEQYNLTNYSIVRPSNVYGEGDNFDPETAMVIPSLMAKIKRGDNPVVVWGDGSGIRDFVYVADVAQGIIQAMQYGTRGEIVNLCGVKAYSIREILETLASFIDFQFEFDLTQPQVHKIRVMDIEPAKRLIHYNPIISLREGLERTWNWLKQV